MNPFTKHIPSITQHNDITTVSNSFFKVTHDREKGGCPVSIIFKNGSQNNFLKKPLAAHIALKEGEKIVFYRQCFYPAKLFTHNTDKKGPQIVLEGVFYNENGAIIPVRFRQTYCYEAWGLVRVCLELEFEKRVNDVYEIGVCNFYLSPEVNIIGVRPGCPPPPPAGYFLQAESELKWYEIDYQRSYKQQYNLKDRLIPSYFCAFQKGVEGIEFWLEDKGETWNRLFGIDPGRSLFMDDSGKVADSKFIRLEPFCDWRYPESFGPGKLVFNYILGLPFIKNKKLARKNVFHTGFNSRCWPDERKLREWADAGISILRLHDDNSWEKPSWRDCYYPPYPEEDIKRMDNVIKLAHTLGIKVVPYFSLKEFHPDCPEYLENVPAWKRWVYEDGRILDENGPYGGYMCMKSGWLEFRKKTIDQVLNNHAFDGVYYDHLWYRYCRHPEHGKGCWHTDSEEILDFLFWTRERVGKDGIIFIHTSGCPTMIGENLSNLVFIGEDMSFARPLPGTHPPDLDFVPITPRNWVPAGAHFKPSNNFFKQSVLIQFLEHCPPSGTSNGYGMSDPFTLKCVNLFTAFELNTFDCYLAHESPVDTGNKNIYANLYTKPGKAIIFCVNIASSFETSVLRIDHRKLNYKEGTKLRIQIEGRKNIVKTAQLLRKEGMKIKFQPETPIIIKIDTL